MDKNLFIYLAALLLLVSTMINLLLLARIELLRKLIRFMKFTTALAMMRVDQLKKKQDDRSESTKPSAETADGKARYDYRAERKNYTTK